VVAAEPCDNSNEKWCATCLFCIVQPYRSTDELDCIRSNKNVWWLCGESAEGCPTDSKIWCGLGYTGPLCSNCDDGFGRGGIDRENNCERCGSLVRQFGSFFMFVAACLFAWMLHFLIGWFAVTKNDLALTHARLGIALVISNADYGTNLWPRVVGADVDAKAIARKLRLYGYDVVYVANGTQDDIKRAMERFEEKLDRESKYQHYKQMAPGLGPGEVAAVIFYVGHGRQHGETGENCLVPVDHSGKANDDATLVPVNDLLRAARPELRKGPTICFLDANHMKKRGPMVPMQDGTKKDLFRCPLSKVVMSDPVMLDEDPCESEAVLKARAKAGEKEPASGPDKGWCYERSALGEYCKSIKKAGGADAIVGNPRTGEPIECSYDKSTQRLTLAVSANAARKKNIKNYTKKSALGPINQEDLDENTLVIFAASPNTFAASTDAEDSNDYHPGLPNQASRAYAVNLTALLKLRRGVDEMVNLMASKVSAETLNIQRPYRVGKLTTYDTSFWELVVDPSDKDSTRQVEKLWSHGFIINGKLPMHPSRVRVQFNMDDETEEAVDTGELVQDDDEGSGNLGDYIGVAKLVHKFVNLTALFMPSVRVVLSMIQIMSGVQVRRVCRRSIAALSIPLSVDQTAPH
jgi:hypothetical protein